MGLFKDGGVSFNNQREVATGRGLPKVNGSTVELLLLTGGLKQFNQFFTFLHQAGLRFFCIALHQWVPQVC